MYFMSPSHHSKTRPKRFGPDFRNESFSGPFDHQVLVQDISHLPLPDVALVAERAEPTELGRLLQLVLGCAVNCERKQGLSECLVCFQ